MDVIFFWVGFATVVGFAAKTRGRSGFNWFAIALVITPLLAGLIVMLLPRLTMTQHEQLLFDAMSEEQQQRVLQRRAIRAFDAMSERQQQRALQWRATRASGRDNDCRAHPAQWWKTTW